MKLAKKTYFKVFFLLFLFIFTGLNLIAQSDEVIDELLAEKKASFGKSAYIVLTATGMISEDASEDKALSLIREKGWKSLKKDIEEPINLGELSYIIMKAFEMKGGLMYTLFPRPRYASRELSYLGMISGSFEMYRVPSGEEVLRILGRVIDWKETQS